MKRCRRWFVLYSLHSALWFSELKDLAVRVVPLREPVNGRELRVKSAAAGRAVAWPSKVALGASQRRASVLGR